MLWLTREHPYADVTLLEQGIFGAIEKVMQSTEVFNAACRSASREVAELGKAIGKGLMVGIYSFNPLQHVRLTIPFILFGIKPKPVKTWRELFKEYSKEYSI